MGSAYGSEYFEHSCGLPYERSEPHWAQFFGRVADAIAAQVGPRRVLDAGCAKGFLVEALRDRGIEAFGFDISDYAVGEVRDDIRPYCWVADVAEPLSDRYDLITCIEVLEHLPEERALAAIGNLATHADVILFSSTPDDFTEPTHVNVRPVLWWLQAFRNVGFAPDPAFDAAFISPQAMLLRKTSVRASDETLELFARNRELTIALDRARNNGNAHSQALAQSQAFELKMLRAELDNTRQALAMREREAQTDMDVRRELEHDVEQLRHELQNVRDELEVNRQHLTRITSSFGWRVISAARVRRDRLLPAGTRRRRYADLGLAAVKYAAIYGPAAFARRLARAGRNQGITNAGSP